MNKGDKIAGFVSCEAGFKIRSKQDAKHFLAVCVGVGSELVFPNLTNSNEIYVVMREYASPAIIAKQTKDDNPLKPTVFLYGMEAVEMAYRARRSINARFFSAAE